MDSCTMRLLNLIQILMTSTFYSSRISNKLTSGFFSLQQTSEFVHVLYAQIPIHMHFCNQIINKRELFFS